jgi:hypothetical protein
MEYSDYIEGLTAAGALDGTEILGVSKSGAAKKTTSKDVVDFISTLNSVDTTGGTITLDLNNEIKRRFTGSTSFSAARDFELSNSTNAKEFFFIFELSATPSALQCPSDFISDSVDWDSGTDTWTAPAAGKYKIKGEFLNGEWWLTFNGPYL